MDKKIIIRLVLLIILLNVVFPQNADHISPKLSPIVKSALIPGWGQYSLNRPTRGNIFISTELLTIALTTFSYIHSNSIKDNYIAIAHEHAGVNRSGKEYQYWVDIGNYNSIDDFNAEHLRWREFENIYPDDENWNWEWDTDDNRKEFESLRIKSDKFQLIGKFLVGSVILNHIISTVDAIYLHNVSISKNVQAVPIFNPNLGLAYISFQFNLK